MIVAQVVVSMIMYSGMIAGKRIFLVGYMGCGKTYTAKRLARKYDLNYIDLDQYIERRFFKTVSQIFAEKGEEGFRKLEHNMLEEVCAFENVVISTGGGTACFYDNMELMNSCGDTVYLQASIQSLFDFLKNAKQNRPLLKGKNDEELLAFIDESLKKREPYYLKAKYVIDSADERDLLFDQLLKNNLA